jgi:hypothetical protein
VEAADAPATKNKISRRSKKQSRAEVSPVDVHQDDVQAIAQERVVEAADAPAVTKNKLWRRSKKH